MSIALEHLFDYDDFRKFMQDYFDEQKKMRAVFSHRFFAAKAGFKLFVLPKRNPWAIQPHAQIHREDFKGHGF